MRAGKLCIAVKVETINIVTTSMITHDVEATVLSYSESMISEVRGVAKGDLYVCVCACE
jgi:hypothetical protein